MIILQTRWSKGRCWLWGETARQPADGLSPHDAGATELRRVLRQLLWDDAAGLAPQQMEIELPTIERDGERIPLASFPLFNSAGVAKAAPSDENPSLVTRHSSLVTPPLLVTAVPLEGKPLLLVLNAVRDRRIRDGIAGGVSIRIFAEFLKFTGALVAFGHYLPGLVRRTEGEWHAVWQPCLDGANQRTFRRLVPLLPPVALDGETRQEAATGLLALLTDTLVRNSVVTRLSQAQAERGRFYSAHDAWSAALRGESSRIRWNGQDELDELGRELEKWRYPVTCQQRTETVLRFELTAPDAGEKPWPLTVRLASRKGIREFPMRAEDGATKDLLLSLGEAVLLFPPLATAKFEGERFGCQLTRDEAYLFLTISSGVLSRSGYDVSLPSGWIAGATSAVKLVAKVSASESDKAHSMDEKVRLQWSVSLAGEEVTTDELARLLHAQSPLVFFRGKWIQVEVKELQEAFRLGKRKKTDTLTAREVVGLSLGNAAPSGFAVEEVRAEGWLQPFLQRLSGEHEFRILEQPGKLQGTLRPYQVRGFSWLCFLRQWGFGACLADDMGLGKTVQTLAFLLQERAKGEKRPVLIVGPMSVLGNWMRETQRFAPTLSALLHHGAERKRGVAFQRAATRYAIVFTSYALLYRDAPDLRSVRWAGVVLDEAQNIKNPDTRQSAAARSLPGDYRIALTGTPLENHVGDVWSIMDFLNPGLLGNRARFRERFFRPIQTDTDPDARRTLRRIIAPFVLRRLKTDREIIRDLPEKIEGKVYCPLTLEQAQLYREVLDSFRLDLESAEGIARRGRILAVLTHLKQICNHPSNYLSEAMAETSRSGKLTRLTEMLEEVFEAGESALIFTQYAEMGKLLRQNLSERFAETMPFLHGALSRTEHEEQIRIFLESERPLAFILSLKAGGTGLNLTKATHVFHYDRWWNPAVENQATDRAFRIGQNRNVVVHKFVCTGTLEDRIDRLIAEKTALGQAIIASGESGLTNLNDTALEDLLRLDTELPLGS
ncbi:MAG: DEAD/DEAH box helicase [Kiritimatiellae bacterium]|nr:DEAD/DEAH box helicase [Kiritimatiellia bacterium]